MVQQIKKYKNINQVPTEYQNRICTDIICIIIGFGFTICLLALAIFMFNWNNFIKVNFPTDTDGKLCGIDHAGYHYVYFANPPQIAQRLCVSKCPTRNDQKLSCIKTNSLGCRYSSTPGFEVQYYQNQPIQNRNGFFCLPTDSELKKQILQNSKLLGRDMFLNSQDTIVICSFVALGLSILYFGLVQYFPVLMAYLVIIMGVISILATTINVWLYPTNHKALQIIFGASLIILLLIIIITVWKNYNTFKLHSQFIKHSSQIISSKKGIISYLPLFLIIMIAFTLILIFEFVSYWTSGLIQFNPAKSLFYQLKGDTPIAFSSFLIVQGIWGLTFIKQAFNFCISNIAVQWYYRQQNSYIYPLKLLIMKHLGSIIAASFMTGFFTLLDFVMDFLKPDIHSPESFHKKLYQSICCCCDEISDFVRSDSMAYINLVGNPYCNSSRYCQYLCESAQLTQQSQSTSRSYRICAHFLITGIVAILALYIKGNISLYAMGVIMILTLFICTLFISLHADCGQALQIILLQSEVLEKREKQIAKKSGKQSKQEMLRKSLAQEIYKYNTKEQREQQPQIIQT